MLPQLSYDLCVLTGDYRGKTFGPFEATIAGMARLRGHLEGPIYGVLGNHDLIRMVPALEEMGIRMLVNEAEPLLRDGHGCTLPASTTPIITGSTTSKRRRREFPHGEFSILLSHTPEIYRQAAHAGFDLLLSGHTHGGQICLPGAIPLTLDFDPAATNGIRLLALWPNGRLHLGRCRLVRRRGQNQLPSRDHPSPPACRLSGGSK